MCWEKQWPPAGASQMATQRLQMQFCKYVAKIVLRNYGNNVSTFSVIEHLKIYSLCSLSDSEFVRVILIVKVTLFVGFAPINVTKISAIT